MRPFSDQDAWGPTVTTALFSTVQPVGLEGTGGVAAKPTAAGSRVTVVASTGD